MCLISILQTINLARCWPENVLFRNIVYLQNWTYKFYCFSIYLVLFVLVLKDRTFNLYSIFWANSIKIHTWMIFLHALFHNLCYILLVFRNTKQYFITTFGSHFRCKISTLKTSLQQFSNSKFIFDFLSALSLRARCVL